MFGLFGKKGNADFSGLHTDIHSHLIPGIDDGAPTLQAAISLIRGMASLGFKKIITTPHIMWEMYPNKAEDILNRLSEVKEALIKEKIEVSIEAAAEYFLDEHTKKMVEGKERLLTISGHMVLVEFSMASPPLDLKEILFEMQLQGYQPVIAHPERYTYNERNKGFFDELKAAGYLFQLNLLSLAGFYGKGPVELANYFIKKDYYDLAGTDLHSPRHLEVLKNPAIAIQVNKLLERGRLLNPGL